MIKLYGQANSSAGRVYTLLEELGLPYEAVEVDLMNGGAETPEYLKLNPNGKIPCLVDGETVLWESVAINLYLAEKYRPALLGKTPAQRGANYQWSVWSMTELQPPFVDLLIQTVFVPEPHRNASVIERARGQVPRLLTILNAALDRPYIAGDEYGVSDLNLASVVSLAPMLGIDLTPYKNVTRWLETVTSRPAWKKILSMRAE